MKQFLNFSPGNSAGGPGSNPKSSPSLRRTQSSMQLLGVTQGDLEALIRTLRRLLAAVTRILLLADNVVVKQLLVASTNSTTSTMMVDGSVQKSGGNSVAAGVAAGSATVGKGFHTKNN